MADVAPWTVIAGITGATWASICVAVGTGLLAVATFILALYAKGTAGEAKKTADEAVKTSSAALTEAQATTDLAKATNKLAEEATLDRELSWSPYLVLSSPLKGGRPEITIQNVGTGPALRCFYFQCTPTKVSEWWCGRAAAVASGGSVLVGCTNPGEVSPTYLLHVMPADMGMVEEPLAALFCEDIVGNRIRFLVDRPGRDIWRLGETPKPQWAQTPLLWGYPSMQPR